MEDQLSKLDLTAVRGFLESLGCTIRFHEHEWVDCLIASRVQSWKGHGQTRDASFRAALALVFPNGLALDTLYRALNTPRSREVSSTRRSITPSIAPQMVASKNRASVVPPSLAPSLAPGPRFTDPDASLEVLDILLERIHDSREELGLCTPGRQRLTIMAWICEARAHTEHWDDDERVRERVSVTSRLLTDIGKTFWPGSVNALQLHIQPSALPKALLGGAANSWASAADLAEQALRAREVEDERKGRDAYGWADREATWPKPDSPKDLLATLVGEVEGFSGPLRQAPPEGGGSAPDASTLARWVRQLRWVRTADVAPGAWSRLAGRFRFWLSRKDGDLSAIARELHEAHSPTVSWAELLGRDVDDAGESALGVEEVQDGLLLERARKFTEGKRSVFVSHRRDPAVQTQLQAAFLFASLDCKIAEPRRLASLGEAIQEGVYDLVLGATGFQAPTMDTALAQACRTAGIHYVRVTSGRPLTCLRALARAG